MHQTSKLHAEKKHKNRENFASSLFMFILMTSYLCNLKCFMHALKCLTELKDIETSTQCMNDEEKVATLKKAT